MSDMRKRRGATAYQAGRVAEDQVSRYYERSGHVIAARRWRGVGGEIDVILQDGARTVFVEVKRGPTHAEAAMRLGARQIARLFDCAAEYMGSLPDGQLSEVRFDLALVDGTGRIEVIENALAA
ncbi:YraN family protein [Jannaschia seohaensis]|uniref:Putative endonuclease n=1 Tax=Jannaschia seohaensis TaxID=475081 RepID=A0A2Y9C812_9RHOB|nr:YraN family protein [Jannaschia seohaensis]PWJ17420.1 putative endonuclease [Jannaschia seohaensis]SSA47483.1 putative endonuclease [Jannaschia seohaensis]